MNHPSDSTLAREKQPDAGPIPLPLNLGLNDGTYMPQACLDLLQRLTERTALRNYTSAGNDDLRQVIARVDGVKPENIFLHNGSGPILKLVMPGLIRDRIMESPLRIARHLLGKRGYPMLTPRFTYSKVPIKGANAGLRVEWLRSDPETGFSVDPNELESLLKQRDYLVYIVNPNNPTGNLMIDRAVLVSLISRYPRSTFWVDEAYVQYVDPKLHTPLSCEVPKHENLVVGRTFSFAYGLAGARVGYLLASPSLVQAQEAKLTNYRVGKLSAHLAMAALDDPDHLSFIRRCCAEQRAFLTAGLGEFGGIEVFPATTNFLLCRFTNGRSGVKLADALARRGVLIKKLGGYGPHTFDEYFRVTLGIERENRFLLTQMAEVLESGVLKAP